MTFSDLSERDRRALIALGVVAAGLLIYYFATRSSRVPAADIPQETAAAAEKRLAVLRERAATVPGKVAVLKEASAELTRREKGLIQADTAHQAQAQLLQVVRRVARKQNPPLEIGQADFSQPRRYGDAYGEVSVAVTMNCRIEQLVNMISDLTAQPELVATSELRIGPAHATLKTMQVRMVFSGLVPRRLVPENKGGATL